MSCVFSVNFFHICLGDSGVWGLKKNFALLELLERLQNGATNQSGMAEDALKGMGEVRKLPFCSVTVKDPHTQAPFIHNSLFN